MGRYYAGQIKTVMTCINMPDLWRTHQSWCSLIKEELKQNLTINDSVLSSQNEMHPKSSIFCLYVGTKPNGLEETSWIAPTLYDLVTKNSEKEEKLYESVRITPESIVPGSNTSSTNEKPFFLTITHAKRASNQRLASHVHKQQEIGSLHFHLRMQITWWGKKKGKRNEIAKQH